VILEQANEVCKTIEEVPHKGDSASLALEKATSYQSSFWPHVLRLIWNASSMERNGRPVIKEDIRKCCGNCTCQHIAQLLNSEDDDGLAAACFGNSLLRR